MRFGSASFNPETVILLTNVVDYVWDRLPRDLRSPESRGTIAKALLPLTSEGERDPVRLQDYALSVVPVLLRAEEAFGLNAGVQSARRRARDERRQQDEGVVVVWLRAVASRRAVS